MSAPHATNLVLLDAGGVVLDGLATRNVTRALALAVGAGEQDVHRFFRAEINPVASTGRRDETWAFERLAERFGAFDAKQLARVARQSTLPLAGIDAVLSALSARGPVWMLSNYIAPWLRDALAERQLLGYFEKLFISSETGLRKPSPHAFAQVLAQWGGAPQSVLFVDDAEANLRAAETLGMRTVLSTGDPAAWAAQLAALTQPPSR